ncbi:MAG: hypothetical protein JWP75_131 [Frondihabitans sp.]|nr:hypothetical protein [Frondihabitans sp.]
MRRLLGWVVQRAPAAAVRRAGRIAIVGPLSFGLAFLLTGDAVAGLFGAFGSIVMLVYSEFTGPWTIRLQSQAALFGTTVILVTIGTAASQTPWLAVTTTVVFGFAILFSGVLSSILATASTSMIVTITLSVAFPGPVDSIPFRLVGWGIAGALSFAAVRLLWPAPPTDPLRTAVIGSLRASAAYLSARGAADGSPEAIVAAASRARDSLDEVQRLFFSAPYQPGGLSSSSRSLLQVVEQLIVLDAVFARTSQGESTRSANSDLDQTCSVALAHSADQLASTSGEPPIGQDDISQLNRIRESLERAAPNTLPTDPRAYGPDHAGELVDTLEPTFLGQELAFIVSDVVASVDRVDAFARRSWFHHVAGIQIDDLLRSASALSRRSVAHLQPRSVWFRNSLRGALGFGLAVLLASVFGLEHGFWIVFGTLSVLRSNALSTGQNAVRAILGTVIGLIIGAVILLAVGTNPVANWIVLPFAIGMAALAPAAIGFAAGQAAFTVTLLLMFNVVSPVGWQFGLVRIEDISLGCAVSVVVGLLLWPRGAGRQFRSSLSAAFRASSDYLTATLDYAVARCDSSAPSAPDPAPQAGVARDAARRLDDAFRQFIAERGTKPVALSEISGLVLTAASIRRTADAICDLWQGHHDVGRNRRQGRQDILALGSGITDWYDDAAEALDAGEPVSAPAPNDERLVAQLAQTLRRDLTDPDGLASLTAVQMIWTANYLETLRRLQTTLRASL